MPPVLSRPVRSGGVAGVGCLVARLRAEVARGERDADMDLVDMLAWRAAAEPDTTKKLMELLDEPAGPGDWWWWAMPDPAHRAFVARAGQRVGSVAGLRIRGVAAYQGLGQRRPDPALADKCWRAAAARGDAIAAAHIAQAFRADHDGAQALCWAERAVRMGLPAAWFEVGGARALMDQRREARQCFRRWLETADWRPLLLASAYERTLRELLVCGYVALSPGMPRLVPGPDRRRVCGRCGAVPALVPDGPRQRRPCVKCGGCLQMYYCNSECQRKDWFRHQLECQSVPNRRDLAAIVDSVCDSRQPEKK